MPTVQTYYHIADDRGIDHVTPDREAAERLSRSGLTVTAVTGTITDQ